MKRKKVKSLSRVNFQSKSLNEKIDDVNGAEFGDLVENNESESPLASALDEDDRGNVKLSTRGARHQATIYY